MNKQSYEQVGVAMTCRGYEEYVRMFDLSETDLAKGMVLDVAAGASSFTAELNNRGYKAKAIDPRYARSVQEWIEEASGEIAVSTSKIVKLAESFDWSYYGSPEQHRAGREASLARFSEHLSTAAGKECYRAASLPELPFDSGTFSTVLCSHFLFLYADQFDFEFHRQSVLELMRVCQSGGAVRIYPIYSLRWEPYPGMEQLLQAIKEHGGKPEIRSSKLPFIPSSNDYLHISI